MRIRSTARCIRAKHSILRNSIARHMCLHLRMCLICMHKVCIYVYMSIHTSMYVKSKRECETER